MIFTNNDRHYFSEDEYANGGVLYFDFGWATVRNAALGKYVYGEDLMQYGIGSKYYPKSANVYSIERGFFYFDTSALPDTATIIEASLHVYKVDGDTIQEIAVLEGTQSNYLDQSDYNNFGTVLLGESTPGGLGWRDIELNPFGIATISKTGWTRFCLKCLYFDYLNMAPTSENNTFKTYFSKAPAGRINSLKVK